MIDKTSGIEFQKYGAVYDDHKHIEGRELIAKEMNITTKVVSHLFCFDCNVYIELIEGLATILIGDSLDNSELKTFAIHHYLRIKPNKYFNLIPLSKEIKCCLIIPSDYNLKTGFLNPHYVYNSITPKITINEMLGYYYVVKSPHYRFKGESHNYYELTYVDHGSLDTTVDGKTYTLENYDLMIYGPSQFHTQQITTNSSCSYLTLIFSLSIDDNSALLNRVFHCDNDLYQVLKKFVNESNSSGPYSDTLMLCHLQEIIVLLMRYDIQEDAPQAISNSSMQHFQDKLLQDILNYMEETVTESITIEEICHKFSISRSSLQTLFKHNLNISPKNHMIQLKLKKSKELIRENKYTISEISLLLGFSSIHYFSRTFKQHFDITPSEFSKKLYDD